MRLPNNKNIPANKAAISITATLYDRRALDCTIDKPLVNSLNNLTFLASSSSKVRETLVGDGGISRLVDILNECYLDDSDLIDNELLDNDNIVDKELYKFGELYENFQKIFFEYLSRLLNDLNNLILTNLNTNDSKQILTVNEDIISRNLKIFINYINNYKLKKKSKKQKMQDEKKILIAWKWTLTLQVLVLCGTRGTEKIRKKIVKSGIIQIVATVLDNYLLVKSGKVKIDNKNEYNSSVDNSKDFEDFISKTNSTNFDVAFKEILNSIHLIIGNINGYSPVGKRDFSIADIQNQIKQFSNSSSSIVSPQQMSCLGNLLLGPLKLLEKLSFQKEVRSDLDIRLLNSIQSNVKVVTLLIKNLTSNMKEINNNIHHLEILKKRMDNNVDKLSNNPASATSTNPFALRHEDLNTPGIANMARSITDGLVAFGQSLTGHPTQYNETSEIYNPIRATESIKRFNIALRDILFDDSSNLAQDYIQHGGLLHGNGSFWIVATKNSELKFNLDTMGNLSINCCLSGENEPIIIQDLIAISKEFTKEDSDPLGSIGLERYSGKFNININETHPSAEGLVYDPNYFTILAHLFKNVFFRDFEGKFCTNSNDSSSILNDNSHNQMDLDHSVTSSNPSNDTVVANETNVDENSMENSNSPNNSEKTMANPPRHFFHGKIVPVDDDIIWVLQLLAFVSKYTYMKDVLQFTYIVPKLSLRDYPHDINVLKNNPNLENSPIDLISLSKKIAEKHFKNGWDKMGNEIPILNSKLGSTSEMSFLFSSGSTGSSLFRFSNNQGVTNEYNDLINKFEMIENKLVSLKIDGGDLEKINENIKTLEKLNRDDITELFKFVNNYKVLANASSYKELNINLEEDVNEEEEEDEDNVSSDDSTGDEMESVEFGQNYASNTKLVQAIDDESLGQIQSLNDANLNLKYDLENINDETEFKRGTLPSIDEALLDDEEITSKNKNNFSIKKKSIINHTKNNSFVNFEDKYNEDFDSNLFIKNSMSNKINKSMLLYQIDKKFEKILKLNSKLIYKMKKIQFYEKKKDELSKKWDYDNYDFDDSNYETFLGENVSNENEISINFGYQRLKEKFLHLPLNYYKSPIIISLVDNYSKNLPFINYNNYLPSNEKDLERFNSSQSTIVSKHDLDYSSIPLDYLNIFGLVELFSSDMFSTEFNHWAGVIMRNSCRKDEQKGGIRQCGNTRCGKWETEKRFSKCKRCRRAKYCSRDCQYKAWEYHKYWCQPATNSTSSNTSSTTATAGSNNDNTASTNTSVSRSRHHHHHHRSPSRSREWENENSNNHNEDTS